MTLYVGYRYLIDIGYTLYITVLYNIFLVWNMITTNLLVISVISIVIYQLQVYNTNFEIHILMKITTMYSMEILNLLTKLFFSSMRIIFNNKKRMYIVNCLIFNSESGAMNVFIYIIVMIVFFQTEDTFIVFMVKKCFNIQLQSSILFSCR